MINDILDFSKLESAKMEIEDLPMDLEELFTETLDVFAYRTAEKGLELNYHIEPTTARFFNSDFQRLKQILVNLVGNAIKFTEKGEILIVAQASLAKDRNRRHPLPAFFCARHRHRHRPPTSFKPSSKPSHRRTSPPRANTAAPASASPSPASLPPS